MVTILMGVIKSPSSVYLLRVYSGSEIAHTQPSELALSQFYRRKVRLGGESRKELSFPLPAGSRGQ